MANYHNKKSTEKERKIPKTKPWRGEGHLWVSILSLGSSILGLGYSMLGFRVSILCLEGSLFTLGL